MYSWSGRYAAQRGQGACCKSTERLDNRNGQVVILIILVTGLQRNDYSKKY